MNWSNPWVKREANKQMSSVRVNKKTKERCANAMIERFGVNWQYHHGEHFSKALDMYLDFMENMNGEPMGGDMEERISCLNLIKMLENDLSVEIRKRKETWIKHRKKGETEKVDYDNGVVKGLNIAFSKMKLIKNILKPKE